MPNHTILHTILVLSLFNSLTASQAEHTKNWDERDETSLVKTIYPLILPDVETQPVSANMTDDAADDPAIWVHPKDSSKSVIYGTNKRSGLAVYNLEGEQLQYLPIGSINNVDVRYNCEFGETKFDLAAATNRTTQAIDVFTIDSGSGLLTPLFTFSPTEAIDDTYGFCLGQDRKNKRLFAYVNGKNGVVEQWEIQKSDDWSASLARSLKVPTQTEGMVCDDLLGVLYVGEEESGIWKFDSAPNGAIEGTLINESKVANNASITYDLEGLSIYYLDETTGYLIASSQGNHSYAVFEREGTNKYLGSFSLEGNDRIDGVEETDGLDVINLPLGERFESGLFVAQDGYNFKTSKNEEGESQNFKIVSWSKIAEALGLKSNTKFSGWMNR